MKNERNRWWNVDGSDKRKINCLRFESIHATEIAEVNETAKYLSVADREDAITRNLYDSVGNQSHRCLLISSHCDQSRDLEQIKCVQLKLIHAMILVSSRSICCVAVQQIDRMAIARTHSKRNEKCVDLLELLVFWFASSSLSSIQCLLRHQIVFKCSFTKRIFA